jgi:fructose-1,6-bisphosphatase/inositol monophosphatase family enzyme
MSAPAVDRQLLELAVSVAQRAGDVAAERFFAADFTVQTKADGTDVTDVDLAVEELVRSELLRHTPGDEVYGEEAGIAAGTSGRRWIIDPIDGTAYFAHGIPLFACLIAYEDSHGPAIGVINEPVARRMVFAGRGLGCWVRTGQGPRRRPVLRDNTELRQARVQPGAAGQRPHLPAPLTPVDGTFVTGAADRAVVCADVHRPVLPAAHAHLPAFPLDALVADPTFRPGCLQPGGGLPAAGAPRQHHLPVTLTAQGMRQPRRRGRQ